MVKLSEKEEGKMTHREVFTVEFEVLPHVNKQVQVETVQQKVNRHVSLLARLQKITKQLHITEAVHHYGQGLNTHGHELLKNHNELRSQISLTRHTDVQACVVYSFAHVHICIKKHKHRAPPGIPF